MRTLKGADADRAAALMDKLHGLPSVGQFVGGAQATGPEHKGTQRWRDIQVDEETGERSYVLTYEDETHIDNADVRLTDGRPTRVTRAEVNELKALRDSVPDTDPIPRGRNI